MTLTPIAEGPAPVERTGSSSADPLGETRAFVRALVRRDDASPLKADPADAVPRTAKTFSLKTVRNPSEAGTPAEAGGRGVIVSVKV